MYRLIDVIEANEVNEGEISGSHNKALLCNMVWHVNTPVIQVKRISYY